MPAAAPPSQGCSPDGTVGVDLCHHLLPAGHGAVVAHFPERVVPDGLTLLELRACATLVELVTLWGYTQSARDPPSVSRP